MASESFQSEIFFLSLLKYCGDAFMLQDEPGPQRKNKNKKLEMCPASKKNIYIRAWVGGEKRWAKLQNMGDHLGGG